MIVDRDGVLMIVSDNQTTSIEDKQENKTVTVYMGNSRYNMNIVKNDVGTVDYDTGDIITTVRPTRINDGSGYIYFTAKPRINDIIPKQNTIVTIEPNDVAVSCIDDTDRIVENRVRGY